MFIFSYCECEGNLVVPYLLLLVSKSAALEIAMSFNMLVPQHLTWIYTGARTFMSNVRNIQLQRLCVYWRKS